MTLSIHTRCAYARSNPDTLLLLPVRPVHLHWVLSRITFLLSLSLHVSPRPYSGKYAGGPSVPPPPPRAVFSLPAVKWRVSESSIVLPQSLWTAPARLGPEGHPRDRLSYGLKAGPSSKHRQSRPPEAGLVVLDTPLADSHRTEQDRRQDRAADSGRPDTGQSSSGTGQDNRQQLAPPPPHTHIHADTKSPDTADQIHRTGQDRHARYAPFAAKLTR